MLYENEMRFCTEYREICETTFREAVNLKLLIYLGNIEFNVINGK